MFEKKIIVNLKQDFVTGVIIQRFADHSYWECVIQDENHLRIQARTALLSNNNDPFQLDVYLEELDDNTAVTIADSGSSFVLVFQIVAYLGTWIAAPAIALSTKGTSILPNLLWILPLVTLAIWTAGKLFRMRTKSISGMITDILRESVT